MRKIWRTVKMAYYWSFNHVLYILDVVCVCVCVCVCVFGCVCTLLTVAIYFNIIFFGMFFVYNTLRKEN